MAARVPLYTPQPTLEAPMTPRPQLVDYIGPTLERLGASVQDFAARLQQQGQQKASFATEQSWLQFQNQQKEAYIKAGTTMTADGAGWHDTWLGTYDSNAAAWLKGIPPDLQQEYCERVQTLRSDWSQKAATDQVSQSYDWFRAGIKDYTAQVGLEIRRNGALDYDALMQKGVDLISNAGLPQAEKDIRIKAWKAEAATARTLGIAADDPQKALDEINAWLSPQPGVSAQGTQSLIMREEGFSATPYWDVNAWRIGYGSDTVTRADGTVEKVSKDTAPISEGDARRDLARQSPEYAARARDQVGAALWDRLPASVQAGLTSVAYNYGSLPTAVVAAAQSGTVYQIADAVEALGKNAGINNPERRKREASVIRGDTATSPLSDLTPDALDKVAGQVEGMIAGQRAADARIASQGREDVAKYGDDLMHNMPSQPAYDPKKPTLTQDWLQANRGNLSEGDYNRFLTALTPADHAIDTPPQEMLRLDRLVQEDPSGALKELEQEYAARLITRGTYDQMTGRAQAIINGEEKRPYIAQIRSYLAASIRPPPDASNLEYQTSLTQLFAFDTWAAQNKDAKQEQAQKYASDVSSSYQKYRAITLRTITPIPRFMAAADRSLIGPNQVTEAYCADSGRARK